MTVPHLLKAGYVWAGVTPLGLFKHVTRPIQFILVVDDFGIKSQPEDDLRHFHLVDHLAKKYRVTEGDGDLFCGVRIKWDYLKCEAEIHMPGFCKKAQKWFNHVPKKVPEHSPHACAEIKYGKKAPISTSSTESIWKVNSQTAEMGTGIYWNLLILYMSCWPHDEYNCCKFYLYSSICWKFI